MNRAIIAAAIASLVTTTAIAADTPPPALVNAPTPTLRLEMDDQGRCTGLRAGDLVLPWAPTVPPLDRETCTGTESPTRRIAW